MRLFQKFTFLLMISFSFAIHGQMTIDNSSYTVNQLVENVLVPSGSGTVVSNVTFSGVYNNSGRYQVGYFAAAGTTLSDLQFSDGLVLSTGSTSEIPLTLGTNPGSVAQMSTGYTSCTPGEIRTSGTCGTFVNDLDVLSEGERYFNAAILEFDFVPVDNFVSFRYVFGSEEYEDNGGFINYQCTEYNDRFGFLISGPGIAAGQGFDNDAENIATLGNGAFVGINSVNSGTVGASASPNGAVYCQNVNPSWVQNASVAEFGGFIDGTELNGNTVALTASKNNLTPGQTYHIRLLITDVRDAAYDAVVYLEAGSFRTESPCDITDISAGTQTTCDPSTNSYTQEVTVTYVDPPATGNLVVNGQNFPITSSPQTVTLTGLTADGLNVDVTASFDQNLGCNRTETSLFTAPSNCSPCTTVPTFSPVPAICEGATLTALPTTSNNGFLGTWSPALDNTQTTTYTFTPATGECAVTTDLTITVNTAPTVTIPAGDDEICVGETVSLSPTTGGTWSSSDVTVATITNAGEVTGVSAGTTDMIFTDGTTGCSSASTDGTITVNTAPTVTIQAGDDEICVGETVSLSPTTGGTWSSSDVTVATITNAGEVTGVSAGTTDMIFTDGTTGCSSAATDGTITVNTAPTVTIQAGDDEICVGETVSLSPTTGGTWSSSDVTVATITNAGEVTGVSAGTADMIFTDGTTGCSSASTDGTITVNTAPTVTIPAGDDEICEGETVSLSPTTGGTWSSSDATVATITNAGEVTGVSAGTTDMIFTDGTTGCSSASTDGTVTVNTAPTVTIPAGDDEICVGETVSLSPTTGGTWSSSDVTVATITNAGEVTGVSAGTADMIFTDGTTGCSSASTDGTITVNTAPTVTIPAGDDEICEGETVSLSPTTGGTWSSSDATVATITNAGEVTGVSAGTADMIFTDGTTGCSSAATDGTITVNTAPTVTIPAGDDEICVGETVSLSPTTGGTWSSSDVTVATITNAGEVTGVSAGTADMIFTDGTTGCSSAATDGTITVNTAPTVTIPAGDDEICVGETVSLSPTTGGAWSSSNATVATITNAGEVTGVSAGTADMIFTDGTTGCSSASTDGTVTVNTAPTVTIPVGDDEICVGEIVSISPNSGGTWSSSDATVATITNAGEVTGVSAGTTDMIFTDGTTGCSSASTDGTITVNTAPTVTIPAGDDEICVGETVSLSPTTGGTWSSSDVTVATITNAGEVTGVSAGTTDMIFTDGTTGCSSASTDGTITVNQESIPTFDLVDPICEGETLLTFPTVSNNGISGVWSPAIDNTQTTIYTFTSDAGQCATSTTLEVEVFENTSSTSSLTICADELPYAWNGIVFNSAGTQTATLQNINGCDSLATLELEVTDIPEFLVSSVDLTACDSQDGQIIISNLDPNTDYQISYNENPLINYTSDNNGEIVISDLPDGTYSGVTVESNGCSIQNTTIFDISLPDGPQVDAGLDQTICEGEQVVLSAANPDGAVINWNNGVIDGVLFTPAPGTTVYTVTATLNGCIEVDQVTVTVTPTPNVSAGNDISICEGESIILSGSGANTYVWDNGIVNGQPFNPSVGTVTYTVVGEVDGCIGTDEVTVNVEAAPPISFDVFSEVDCAYSEITLINTSPGTSSSCFWDMGDGTVLTSCDSVTYAYSQTGCFDVSLTITTAAGCQSTVTVNDAICLESGPIADFTTDPTVAYTSDPTFEFTNESSGAVSYEWDFGDFSTNSTEVNPSHTYPFGQDGFYDVTLIAFNSNGCSDTTVKRIEIREELIFWVPNAFTPDQDQYNEVFQPVFTSGFDPYDYNLLIFNRWGEVMFESNNAAVGWDGTYGGEIVRDGVYVWKIQFKDKYTDERYEEHGHLTLVK